VDGKDGLLKVLGVEGIRREKKDGMKRRERVRQVTKMLPVQKLSFVGESTCSEKSADEKEGLAVEGKNRWPKG